MILDQLYPTGWTDSAGNAFTNQINNGSYFLPITPSDFTDAYFLGWIAWDDVPGTLKIFRQNAANGVWTARPNMSAENVDIGYMARPSTSLLNEFMTRAHTCYSYDTSNTRWRAWSNLRTNDSGITIRGRLPNDIDINTNATKNVTLTFAVAIDNGDTNVSYGAAFVQMSIDDFIYKTGQMSLSAANTDFGGARVDYSVSVVFADLDGNAHTVTSGDYQITYALCYYSALTFLRDIKTDGTGADYDYISPFFRLHADFDGVSVPYVIAAPSAVGGEYESAILGAGYRFTFGGGVSVDGQTYSYDLNDGHYLLTGGYDGDAAYDAIRSNVYNNGRIYKPENANFIFQGCSRTDFCMIRRVYNYEEVYKHLSLISRWTTGDNTYDNGASKYYPLVDGTHFLCDFANGVRDRARLTDWERVGERLDPDSAAYDPADKPPYTPEDDDTPANVGASVLRPSTLGVGGTSGFITQYVLTAAEIATLGRTLWTSFVNPDYWRNFLFSLALDTGSFDMSSLLDYFVSLRVYPFSLINVPSYAATGSPSIYIGSGMVPLTITGSTTLHTINNFADYIDAGSCTVHSAYFHDDFRDFSNVEIMLYLPYCGTVQLNPGDVVGGTLHAQYAIDFATGGCVAYVDLTSAEGLSYPIAVLPGSIGADVPLTATNAGQIAARFAGHVINFASTVTSNAASDLNTRASAATGAITGGASGALSRSSSGIGAIATGGINAGLQHASQALDMATRPAIGIPTLSGGRGFSSFGAPQTAYIQIRRGIYKRPQTYDHTVGAPSSASKTIGSLAGLVKGAVDTAGLSCTADEAAEVRTLIAAGIIV